MLLPETSPAARATAFVASALQLNELAVTVTITPFVVSRLQPVDGGEGVVVGIGVGVGNGVMDGVGMGVTVGVGVGTGAGVSVGAGVGVGAGVNAGPPLAATTSFI